LRTFPPREAECFGKLLLCLLIAEQAYERLDTDDNGIHRASSDPDMILLIYQIQLILKQEAIDI